MKQGLTLTSVDQGELTLVTTGTSTVRVDLPTTANLANRLRFRILKADTGAATVYAGTTLLATLSAQNHRVEFEWDATNAIYSGVGTSADLTTSTLTTGTTAHKVTTTARSTPGSTTYAFGSTAASTSEHRHLSHAGSNGQAWGWNTSNSTLSDATATLKISPRSST